MLFPQTQSTPTRSSKHSSEVEAVWEVWEATVTATVIRDIQGSPSSLDKCGHSTTQTCYMMAVVCGEWRVMDMNKGCLDISCVLGVVIIRGQLSRLIHEAALFI